MREKMANALQEMQVYLDRYTEYVRVLEGRGSQDKLKGLSQLRGFNIGTLKEHNIFWIGAMNEMLAPEFLDELYPFGVISERNHKPIFNNRWVIPIKNELGQVLNLVGYSNEKDERYVYGTGLYYDRSNILFGLENFEIALEKGWAIITEGITDTLSIRDIGYKNVFAWCGTRKSEYKLKVLNRLSHGVIFIHDRDRAGDFTRSHWKTNRYYRFNIPIKYKDIDETLHDTSWDNVGWFKSCMDIAIDWIESGVHNGRQGIYMESTMM